MFKPRMISHGPSGHSNIQYVWDFLTVRRANSIFNYCDEKIQFVNIGKRSVKWLGNVPYSYGNIFHEADNDWPELIDTLRSELSSLLRTDFNSLLINKYNGASQVKYLYQL